MAGAVQPEVSDAALGESLRQAFWSGTVDWASLLVLAGWTAIGALLTARTFTWE